MNAPPAQVRKLFSSLLAKRPRDRPDIVDVLAAPVVALAARRVRDAAADEPHKAARQTRLVERRATNRLT